MKLIQLNIWQGRTIRRALPFLEKQNADILCLQEVYSAKNPVPGHWDAFSSLELIKDSCSYEYVYFSPLYSFFVAGEKVTFGNAILSKTPFNNTKSTFTKGEYIEDVAKKAIIPNQRNVQLVSIEIDGKDLSIVNHHAHREPTADGSEESLDRMKLVKDFIGDIDNYLIIAGDMNVNPSTPTAKVLSSYGRNLTSEKKISSTMTDLAMYVPVSPDHIIVSDDVDVLDFNVSDETVSDHKALILKFGL